MPDFGISEALIAGLTTAGVGAETAAAASPFIVGGLEGAALGAGSTLVTGGDPLTGALTGGLTGGAVGGLGPAIGSAAGIGTTAGDVIAGAGAGAIGSAITGGDPISGALTGGAGGAVSGIFGGASGAGGEAATTSVAPAAGAVGVGGGPSAAGTTTGISVPGTGSGAAPVDLTSGLTDSNPFSTQTAGQTFGVSSASAGGDFGGGGDAATGGLGKIGSNVMGLIEKNPGVLLAGGLLGANLLMGDKPGAAEKQLAQQAGEAGSVGRTLAAFQQSGTLPAGLQAIVDQQTEAAKASLVSQYGELGLGSSTMLSDKLNQLKVQKSAEIAQFADQLGRQGVLWSQLSSQELGSLLSAQTSRDSAFTSALGSFASGLSGLRTGSSTAA